MKHCIACREDPARKQASFELTSAPASAQDIPDAKEVQNDEGVTLHLRQCSGCGCWLRSLTASRWPITAT